jgi:hypothetical protein
VEVIEKKKGLLFSNTKKIVLKFDNIDKFEEFRETYSIAKKL